MSEAKPGFFQQVQSFPSTFWVANTMEIFERMAWYGFFAVSSLYITGPAETGGLGFTSEQRGQLQAIVPFILYLLPVITGALADRYGYKKMFLIAYTGMVVFYYAMGQFKTFPTFLAAFLAVALVAAIFKPVVVGTVARVTNEKNSAMGFGIFYMMVNVGGFVGPLVAGAVRGVSWKYVFIACSCWAAVNLVIVSVFYRDPSTEATSTQKRTLGKVARDMVEVLGNVRFGICAFTALIALMLANQEFEWFSWTRCLIFIPAWLLLNFVWDALMPAGSGNPAHPASHGRSFLAKRMHCSNWRFALFLLIMSGFWTSFNQIFLTMPEYIRDYTDTKPMVDAGRKVFDWLGKPGWLDGLAAIEETEMLAEFDKLARQGAGIPSMVPPEPEKEWTADQAKVKLLEAASSLRQLSRDKLLSDNDRKPLLTMADELTKGAGSLAPAQAKTLTDAATDLHDGVDRNVRTRKLDADPSLTDEDRSTIAALLPKLNAPEAKKSLQLLDIVDGAKAALQYKVRIQPEELAELLEKARNAKAQIDDDGLSVAVATINKRLDSKGKLAFAGEEETRLRAALKAALEAHGPFVPRDAVVATAKELSTPQRELEPAVFAMGVRDLAYRPTIWARLDAGRQVNPEHIVNFDALAIVLLQVIVSFIMGKFHQFTTMIVGMVIAAVGIGLSCVAGGTMVGPVGGLFSIVVAGIVIFAIGEMMASPTSQEYVGRIAPKDRVAVYMGYYFVAVALGNLFGGILSGQLYGKLARDMQRPDLMWWSFGALMLGTAVIFLLYNRFALPKSGGASMRTA
ncbi:MAG: MFS transporter [Phycisphaerales bacterium]|nr:MFS transporter [Phycisphaerales bacterium]